MRSERRRSVLICGLAVLAFAAFGIGSALASGKHRSGPFARGHHFGLSAKQVIATSRKVSSRVIVVLRNQLSSTPANRSHIKRRIQAEASANASILAQVQRSGGSVYRQFHGLNAFAASVSKTERAQLARSSQVAQVVPDTVVTLPSLDGSVANPHAAGSAPQATEICPANPAKPLLEPEALQSTHTAFSDPGTPQAQNLTTGKGVKVAFFADGLDINNPDFIRPDGSHVFIDYKDFSGDGPNAPTGAAEAFGDASSIAAQGRETYDISQFVNPAHPLPAGCNITVRGIAPGASLIGMKVFGNANSSFNSVILQGLDYALTVDHPDVFSESFGGYPIPDSTQDLTRQFNEQAVAAGATVVESTGDSGVTASPSSASSDPQVIAAGASTTFQNYAQGTQYGYQFANGWLSNNISAIESAGFTQAGRVLDLVAPGEANWALCSAHVEIYLECVNFAGQPTNLQSFGGTSESAPFIAGGAALVISAYREAHGGATPSPALVRQLLTSTATDLHAPSSEQGSGEMNTLGAVQAAESVGHPSTALGQNLLFGSTQLDLAGQAGSSFSQSVQVTNVGKSAQTISAHARQIGAQLSNETGRVVLGDTSSPRFVDQFGNAVPYEKIHFTVPAGADRLVAYNSWPSTLSRIDMTLIDPNGKFAATSRAQGDGNHAQVDVADPVAGTWTGIIFRRDGSFFGPVLWQATSQKFTGVDTVTPASSTLAPGQTESVTVQGSFPSAGGDSSQDLVIGSSVVPIAVRSLVPLTSSGGDFSGNLVGGNGRNGFFQPGQIDTYEFDVPRGQSALTVGLTFANDPGTEIFGSLIAPNGLTVTGADNAHSNSADNTTYTNGLQAYARSPQAGRWRFVVDIINPVGGQVLSAPYHGHIGLTPPPVHVVGLPNSANTVLPAGQTTSAKVEMTNNGVGSEDVFLDPRTTQRQQFVLLSLNQTADLPLPLPSGTTPPLFLVPTESNAVFAAAQATKPVTFDFGYGDPDIAAKSDGNFASGFFSGPATAGVWDIAPDPVGPFNQPTEPGRVSVGMAVETLGFDTTVASSTGDLEQETVNPGAAGFSPLALSPGQSGVMNLAITPDGKKGTTVKGTLYVDVFDNRLDLTGEVVAVPYEYTIGAK